MDIKFAVFDLKELKKLFVLLFVANILIIALAYLAVVLLPLNSFKDFFSGTVTWFILGGLFVLSIFYDRRNKKELKSILELENFDEQVKPYSDYYRKRLLWSVLSIVISMVFFVFARKNMFFYLSLFQLVMMLPFYPNKLIICKELQNDEIVFT